MYLHFEGIQVVYFNSTLQQHQYIQFILNCALLILETMSMLIKLVKKKEACSSNTRYVDGEAWNGALKCLESYV
jgi:hypothetical protein